MYKMEWIQECVKKGKYYFSKHGDQERQNDNLTLSEVEEALFMGKILKQYEDTRRGESCLIEGFTAKGKPIHIVCGKSEEWLVVITVYICDIQKYKASYERGER